MSEKELKVINSLKKILLWSLLSGIIFVLSGCGDFVKETDAEACNKAIDERDYDSALSACTSRKDLASAWMGKAGYDIVNLIKASSSAPSAYTKPSGVELGTDDITGAAILNILQLSTDVIDNYTKRATAIKNSKIYLDNASGLLHRYLNDNSSPLSMDEMLLDTYAIAFAMQLDQTIMYDNGTTRTSVVPSGSVGSLSCDDHPVDVSNSTEAQTTLRAMDGHIWTKERDYIQCHQIKTAINSLSSGQAAVINELKDWTPGSDLPSDISELTCKPLVDLIEYLTRLKDNIERIGKKLSLSGDNTKAITNSQSSTDNLTKALGCRE